MHIAIIIIGIAIVGIYAILVLKQSGTIIDKAIAIITGEFVFIVMCDFFYLNIQSWVRALGLIPVAAGIVYLKIRRTKCEPKEM